MFKIRNRSGQELPVDVIKDGEGKRVFLNDKDIVYSEEETSTMKRQEGRRLLRVVEVDEGEITEEDIVNSLDNE